MAVELEEHSTSGCELVAEVARRFGEVRLRVTGASMMPTVWPGDILIVRSCNTNEFEPGQIVLYRRDGKLVAHRIIRIQDDLLTTRGDSVRHDDSPIRKCDVVGRVVALVRRGREVPFGLSFWRRAGAGILRRSDFCLRVAMLLAYRLRRPENEEISWA
jgi:signal peptidase I